MKRSTKKIALSALSIVLATAAIAPATKAAETTSEKSFNVHQLRVFELDARNKNFDLKEGFSVQNLRLSELDARNKVGNRLSTTSLISQRQRVLDRTGSK